MRASTGATDGFRVKLRLFINVVTLLVVAAVSPTLSSSAEETRRGYVVSGGTSAQQTQVHKALRASSFDWSVVPELVHIQISPGSENLAKRGRIRLSAALLDKGRSSWGTVQHEYAHQVDLYLLSNADRAELLQSLGGKAWFPRSKALAHDLRGAERFASTLAWAYWQSPANSMRPRSKTDESAAMEPTRFRTMLARTLGEPSLDIR